MLLFYFVVGICIGSFLNVVIFRMPIMLQRKWHKEGVDILNLPPDEYKKIDQYPDLFNLFMPKSSCFNCNTPIKYIFNIPILGYFLSHTRCWSCKKPIPIQYPLVEILTGCLFLYIGYLHYDIYYTLSLMIFVSFVLVIIFIDAQTFYLPHELTTPFALIGVLCNLRGMISGGLLNSIIGGFIGYFSLWIINFIYNLITKKNGMGHGDFRFLSGILIWVGISGFIPIVFISSLLGISYFIVLYLLKKIKLSQAIPFGPFLGVASIIVLFSNKYFVL